MAQAAKIDAQIALAGVSQTRHPEVLAELERLQTTRTNWTNALVMLIVSAGLFVAAGKGAWKWSWEVVLMIVGILFVHEAGHYLAMKIFHYRNVRMFFIPFFGAAVSGQNYTAPGWKKVIVALMGPLPGIVLGGVLGGVGLIKRDPDLLKVASLTVILNGFQLLPVLPLDGGRVWHAILFSRHPILDVLFSLAAAGGLALFSVAIGAKLLLYLGIFMLLGAPMAYKVAKIAAELQREGYGSVGRARPVAEAGPSPAFNAPAPPTTPTEFASLELRADTAPASPLSADHLIPHSIAEVIVDRVRARFPRLQSARTCAQLTARIYETLVSRPPGVAASIGFGLLYGVSAAAALVLAAVLIVPQSQRLMDMVAAGLVEPAHVVDPGEIATWRGPAALGVSTSGADAEGAGGSAAPGVSATIVANFKSSADARSAFAMVREQAPSTAFAVCFGDSLLLTVAGVNAAVRTKWLNEFEARTPDVFVAEGRQVWLTLAFEAPGLSQALKLERELSNCLQVRTDLWLIPPWVRPPLDSRSPDEVIHHEVARTLYHKLNSAHVPEPLEFKQLREEINRANQRRDQAEIQRIHARMIEIEIPLLRRELERLRDAEADPAVRAMALAYIPLRIAREHELSNLYALMDSAFTSAEPSADSNGRPEDTAAPDDDEGEADGHSDDVWDALNARERDELGPMLGQWPLLSAQRQPAPEAMDLIHTHGAVELAGGSRMLLNIEFHNPAQGIPTLLTWLKQRGCSDFKYDLARVGRSEFDLAD